MVVSYIKSVLPAVALLTAGTMMTSGAVAAADDKTAIESTLSSYNAALNGGDTAAVLPLYTEDGIFMPPYSGSVHLEYLAERALAESTARLVRSIS